MSATERVMESERPPLAHSERLHGLFMQAPVPIAVWRGPSHVYEFANPHYQRLVGKRDLIGRSVRDVFADLVDEGRGMFELFDRVYETGEPVVLQEFPAHFDRRGDGQIVEGWFSFNLEPLRDSDGHVSGLMAVAVEVTDQVLARRRVEASRVEGQLMAERLHLAVSAADVGTWDFNPVTGALAWDARCKQLFGLPADASVDYDLFLRGLHPHDRAATDAAVQRALAGGGHYDVEYRTVGLTDGIERWVAAKGRAVLDQSGRAARFIGTVLDITERKRSEERERIAREEAERANASLRALNRIGSLLAAELDHDRLVRVVTDEATALCGAKFGAYFYNHTDERGESYMLWALSGAPREAFEKFGMPRKTAVFAPTFRGEAIVRSDDITHDPRYGQNAPHRGMPEGHLPVRSYLAVPVVSRTGGVIGGLFFGHPEPGRFTEQHERLMAAVAAKAAVAFDNASLFQAARRAEEQHARRARQAQMASDVALALTEGGELRTVLSRCCQAAVDHLDAAFARIWTANDVEQVLELQASAGQYTHIDGPHARVPIGALKIGLIASEREPHLTNDVQTDARVGNREWAREQGMVAFAGYPLLVEGRLIGVMAMFARKPLAPDTLDTLASVANMLAVGIERERSALQLAQLANERERALAEAQLERKRLELLFEDSPASISIIRRNGRGELIVSFANALSREQAGRSDHVGKPLGEAFPELAAQGFLSQMEKIFDAGKPVSQSEAPVHWTRNGQRVEGWFNLTYQPLRDVDGRVYALLAFSVDVTEQVRSRALVKRSEERFRTLVEATAQIIWARDERGEFVTDQPAWHRFTGQSFEQLRGWGWLDAVHPEDRERTRAEWEAALGAPKLYEGEHRMRRDDGEYRHMMVRAVPIFAEDGVLREWIGVHSDVTHRERLIRALERSNQDLDQFAYVASHDLKAPLRGIANLSQWIEEDAGDKLSGESREQLTLMRGRVHRMEALIEGILSYSRAGRARDQVEALEVGKLLKDIVDLVGPADGARVEVGDMPTVTAEKIPLQQVFMNLIGNAVKHARRADALVRVTAEDAGEAWHFRVIDNGPGIAPEFHERIWGIFQTLEARDRVEGAGIGLSVVKKIVESRGGRAWVESEAGSGATFHVLWPKRQQGED